MLFPDIIKYRISHIIFEYLQFVFFFFFFFFYKKSTFGYPENGFRYPIFNLILDIHSTVYGYP